MSRYFVVAALCFLSLAAAEIKQQDLSVIEEQSHGFDGGDGGYSAHAGKYSSASELTDLAHNSALQAKSAVQSQQNAGIQAAFGAKTGFAQAALGAAATAQVALVAKQVIVQNLEQQLHDAEHQLQSELAQYHQTQSAADAAQHAASQSQQQLSTATAALAAVQSAVQHSQQAASQAANSAAAQHEMAQSAKQRVADITEKLNIALGGLHATEISAQKASASAQIAQSNAAAAAQVVAAGSQSGHHSGGNYHHH